MKSRKPRKRTKTLEEKVEELREAFKPFQSDVTPKAIRFLAGESC